ncbi:hypothetical protein P4N68_10000 [Corynebacterium felinum]|uniref:PpGpp synthetase/RelA/SpoT-type nucleotidyltransferase n=1 Tax=Corynebacterium felinum TaxID=131318 RepID=A0ABU2B4I4_9CORY|nr:hypothetical protein [Corynebacterium felinum]MDF5821403.1 hypothetical protein [Corynebacterium felinum]MDR7353508.1 ppGpp synthetase/RelA/SpoT-type nucleotidyltransferase [Corynebacterium felinum]WJY95687.1 hypothetical protein CFELI_10445 [Corynebacterium felinum]
MSFLEKKCPISDSRLKKLGRSLRKGEVCDEEVFDQFILHNISIIDETQIILLKVFENLPFQEAFSGEEIMPYSAKYRFSARPKMRKTIIEKLCRMDKTPIYRIQDIAGLRFDLDCNLDDQYRVAEVLKDALSDGGARRVVIKDLRESPHSGYRAIHIHADFPAGRVEVQLRTALQAQWANVYEKASDIFGRGIRYIDSLEQCDESVRNVLSLMHGKSNEIYALEQERNVSEDPHLGPVNTSDLDHKARALRDSMIRMYRQLDQLASVLPQINDTKLSALKISESGEG